MQTIFRSETRRFACSVLFLIGLLTDSQAAQTCSGNVREAGRHEDVKVLRCLVDNHDAQGIESYRQFLGGWSYSKLSSGIEDVVVRNLNDPVVGGALLHIIIKSGKYQTHRCFEVLKGRVLQSRGTDLDALSAVARTDLSGIEADILQLAGQFPVDQVNAHNASRSLATYFGSKRYAPAVPYLARLLANRKPGYGIPGGIQDELIKIGTDDALLTIYARLSWLATQSQDSKYVQSEASYLIRRLSELPVSTPVDYAALKQSLSPEMAESNRKTLQEMAERRHLPEALPDLMARLAKEPQDVRTNWAFTQLMGFSSVDAWRQVRDEFERLHAANAISADYYDDAMLVLNEITEHPDTYLRAARPFTASQVLFQVKSEKTLAQQPTGSVLSQIMGAYDGLASYCDEGTRIDSHASWRFRRCFSRDGRYIDVGENPANGAMLARWGNGQVNNLWQGRKVAGLRFTTEYRQSVDGSTFKYGLGADMPSRILDVFLIGTFTRTGAIDALSRFHPAEVPHEPGIEVLERLGEIKGSELSRELLFVRQPDHLVMEYQRSYHDTVAETIKLSHASANPSLTGADLEFDLPLVRFNIWQIIGLLWLALYFGAPLYVAYWLIRRKRYRDRASLGIAAACFSVWGATLGLGILYLVSGAWYSEHTTLAANITQGTIVIAFYVLTPISILVLLKRRSKLEM